MSDKLASTYLIDQQCSVLLQQLRKTMDAAFSIGAVAEMDAVLNAISAYQAKATAVHTQLIKLTHPATVIVNTVQGEIACCARHAASMAAIMGALGASVHETLLHQPAQCSNCVNEAAEGPRQ